MKKGNLTPRRKTVDRRILKLTFAGLLSLAFLSLDAHAADSWLAKQPKMGQFQKNPSVGKPSKGQKDVRLADSSKNGRLIRDLSDAKVSKDPKSKGGNGNQGGKGGKGGKSKGGSCHHGDHGHHGSGFGLSFGSSRHYVPGHWEYTSERVLVESGHFEKIWVEPEYKKIIDKDGCEIHVKVREGYMKKVWVPERYETVTTKYWVEGYYETTSSPNINLGFGFRF